MGTIAIEPGETELVIPADDEAEYYATLTGASVQVGRSEREAEHGDRSRPAPAGERGPMRAPANEEVWVHNPDGNNSNAFLNLDHNGFFWEREPRAVIGSVLTSSDNEAAPASDEYVHRHGRAVDASSGVSESFEAPDAADDVLISVDDADDAFEVAVVFEDDAGNELTRRDSGNSGDYSGGSSSDVFVETLIASPFVSVEITGAATSVDYSVYAR